ncbi:MAG TPA: cysteine--tRNA ligase [Verrucomicrobiae bacterium]|nr:cysteine--tRNA ligase [Verrucomicrobiae bacterium]
MKFFNTLTRTKEEFVPLKAPHVGLYTCGPTVYDFVHIGNLRAFMFDDLLRRWLEYRGFNVTHVMNITDVEDRIINKVRESGKPLKEVTDLYANAFLADLDTLNVKRAHIIPRATEAIPGMIAMIEKLIAGNHAYVSDDKCVYYSIKSFPEYGKLSHRQVGDPSTAVARIKSDDYDKEEMADFALWKAWDEKDGDVKWDSPWGPGRPGWHIECSAMSIQHLGETFDIHCGGEDLVFPHHEDEIAQSEAATGKPFVRYWLHNAHLLVEGKKMSKRLNNYYTLRDLLAKGWSGREIRYVLLSAHYRDPLNFTMDGLQAARSALQRMDEFLLKLDAVPAGTVSDLQARFDAAMDDDLNTSAALGALFEFIREANKRTIAASEAAAILATWQGIDQVLGFGMPVKSEVPGDVLALVEERQAARKAKDFKRSDKIRDQLAKQGWVIEDTAKGPRAKRAV